MSWSRNGFSSTTQSLNSTPGLPRTSLLRREPVLLGEDGVHPWRAQEHLQAEGAVGAGLVKILNQDVYQNILYLFFIIYMLHVDILFVGSFLNFFGSSNITEAVETRKDQEFKKKLDNKSNQHIFLNALK